MTAPARKIPEFVEQRRQYVEAMKKAFKEYPEQANIIHQYFIKGEPVPPHLLLSSPGTSLTTKMNAPNQKLKDIKLEEQQRVSTLDDKHTGNSNVDDKSGITKLPTQPAPASATKLPTQPASLPATKLPIQPAPLPMPPAPKTNAPNTSQKALIGGDTHNYDGYYVNAYRKMASVVPPAKLSFIDTLKDIESHIKKRQDLLPWLKDAALRCLFIFDSDRVQNFDNKNNIHLEQILPQTWEFVKTLGNDIQMVFYEQLADVVLRSGLCAQGRILRVMQFYPHLNF